jgi:hypothetical protein
MKGDQVQLFWIDCPKGEFSKLPFQHKRHQLKDCATLDKLARLHCSQEERQRFVAAYLQYPTNSPEVLQFSAAVSRYRRRRFDAKDERQAIQRKAHAKAAKLSKNEFEQLTEGAKILEQDGFGIKVLRLPNERILKLFRRRRLISSQLWGPHALRFKMNATKLQKHGIPTVKVEDIYNIPELDRQAVIYRELQGITLRQWLDEHDDKQVQTKLTAFAHFVAKLTRTRHPLPLSAPGKRARHRR